jgi:hypothetical protein
MVGGFLLPLIDVAGHTTSVSHLDGGARGLHARLHRNRHGVFADKPSRKSRTVRAMERWVEVGVKAAGQTAATHASPPADDEESVHPKDRGRVGCSLSDACIVQVVAEVARMWKAIHAREDRRSAQDKIREVIAKRKGMRSTKAGFPEEAAA